MKIASVADVKARLNSYLDASAAGPVVVTRNGKAVAVILGVPDDESESLLLSHSPQLQAILEKSRKQIREGDVLSEGEFWAQVKSNRAAQRSQRKRRASART